MLIGHIMQNFRRIPSLVGSVCGPANTSEIGDRTWHGMYIDLASDPRSSNHARIK
jgi:hypothetical protein